MRAFLRWLLTRLHYVQRMPAENPPEVTDEATILGFCDASWSLTSVSGGIVIWQACCVKYFNRMQDVPALSSAEAEVVSIVEAAKEQVAIGMLMQTIQGGIPLDPMPLVTAGSSLVPRWRSRNKHQHHGGVVAPCQAHGVACSLHSASSSQA